MDEPGRLPTAQTAKIKAEEMTMEEDEQCRELKTIFESWEFQKERGCIKLALWPEGLVLWVGGEIVWREWKGKGTTL
jgi:hypothetical protein